MTFVLSRPFFASSLLFRLLLQWLLTSRQLLLLLALLQHHHLHINIRRSLHRTKKHHTVIGVDFALNFYLMISFAHLGFMALISAYSISSTFSGTLLDVLSDLVTEHVIWQCNNNYNNSTNMNVAAYRSVRSVSICPDSVLYRNCTLFWADCRARHGDERRNHVVENTPRSKALRETHKLGLN